MKREAFNASTLRSFACYRHNKFNSNFPGSEGVPRDGRISPWIFPATGKSLRRQIFSLQFTSVSARGCIKSLSEYVEKYLSILWFRERSVWLIAFKCEGFWGKFILLMEFCVWINDGIYKNCVMDVLIMDKMILVYHCDFLVCC